MDAWLLQLATLSVTGFLCWVMLHKTIPDMNAKHERVIIKLLEDHRVEKTELRGTFRAEMKMIREHELVRRKKDSDRYHKLHDEIRQLRQNGTGGSGEHKIQ